MTDRQTALIRLVLPRVMKIKCDFYASYIPLLLHKFITVALNTELIFIPSSNGLFPDKSSHRRMPKL